MSVTMTDDDNYMLTNGYSVGFPLCGVKGERKQIQKDYLQLYSRRKTIQVETPASTNASVVACSSSTIDPDMNRVRMSMDLKRQRVQSSADQRASIATTIIPPNHRVAFRHHFTASTEAQNYSIPNGVFPDDEFAIAIAENQSQQSIEQQSKENLSEMRRGIKTPSFGYHTFGSSNPLNNIIVSCANNATNTQQQQQQSAKPSTAAATAVTTTTNNIKSLAPNHVRRSANQQSVYLHQQLDLVSSKVHHNINSLFGNSDWQSQLGSVATSMHTETENAGSQFNLLLHNSHHPKISKRSPLFDKFVLPKQTRSTSADTSFPMNRNRLGTTSSNSSSISSTACSGNSYISNNLRIPGVLQSLFSQQQQQQQQQGQQQKQQAISQNKQANLSEESMISIEGALNQKMFGFFDANDFIAAESRVNSPLSRGVSIESSLNQQQHPTMQGNFNGQRRPYIPQPFIRSSLQIKNEATSFCESVGQQSQKDTVNPLRHSVQCRPRFLGPQKQSMQQQQMQSSQMQNISQQQQQYQSSSSKGAKKQEEVNMLTFQMKKPVLLASIENRRGSFDATFCAKGDDKLSLSPRKEQMNQIHRRNIPSLLADRGTSVSIPTISSQVSSASKSREIYRGSWIAGDHNSPNEGFDMIPFNDSVGYAPPLLDLTSNFVNRKNQGLNRNVLNKYPVAGIGKTVPLQQQQQQQSQKVQQQQENCFDLLENKEKEKKNSRGAAVNSSSRQRNQEQRIATITLREEQIQALCHPIRNSEKGASMIGSIPQKKGVAIVEGQSSTFQQNIVLIGSQNSQLCSWSNENPSQDHNDHQSFSQKNEFD